MMLYLVSQLVLMILIDLYAIYEIKKLNERFDERRAQNFALYEDYYSILQKAENRVSAQLAEIRHEISLLRSKEGVDGAAFGLISAVTDFKEVETIRRSRTDEQKAEASRKRKEWWAKKKGEIV